MCQPDGFKILGLGRVAIGLLFELGGVEKGWRKKENELLATTKYNKQTNGGSSKQKYKPTPSTKP